MSLISINSLLVKYGLLCHTFAFNDLPVKIKYKLGHENHAHFQDCYLSLIANVGPTFWAELKSEQFRWKENSEATKNPVDYFSAKVTEKLLQLTGLTNNAELLYPGTAPAPLILLGELANWSNPSPLGLGLHAKYGPWFAYRALVKTTSPLQSNCSTIVTNNGTGNSNADSPENTESNEKSKNSVSKNSDANKNNGADLSYLDNHKISNATTSPCMSCASLACVTACPGNAVSVSTSFDIGRCANYRLKENSICKEQCHARNACPVGAEYQYSDEQSAYHMTHALKAIVQWANEN